MRVMGQSVAICAQRDEILLQIFSAVAAELLMMDLKIFPRAAELASPVVAPQHELTKLFIFLLFEPDGHLLMERLTH